jgi:hypothetical protein
MMTMTTTTMMTTTTTKTTMTVLTNDSDSDNDEYEQKKWVDIVGGSLVENDCFACSICFSTLVWPRVLTVILTT